MAGPSRRSVTWRHVRLVLEEEFEVSVEEFKLPRIDGQELPSTFILRRAEEGVLYVYTGIFEPSERVLPDVLDNICRRLNLGDRSIFG